MSSRRRFLRRTGVVLLTAPLLPALRAAGLRAAVPDTGTVRVDRYCVTMGAVAGIRIYGPDRRFCDDAAGAAFAEMRRIDALMSAFDPASALSAVNRAAGRSEAPAPAELVGVLESARGLHSATGGAFDVTVGPLMDLYGFTDSGGAVNAAWGGADPCADDRTIAAVLDAVGFRNVRTDPVRMTVGLAHPSTRLDLGGIGVGHALDRAASVLRAKGVESALINHSGDILAIGAPPGSAGWDVGIQDPDDPRGTIATFTLRDRSVSTSGNYENFIETGCGRIGHILDPATGRPPSRFLSVSVMADTSLGADALSTGFFTGGVALCAPAPGGAGVISAYTVRADGDPGETRPPVTEYHPSVAPGRPGLE